MRAPFFSLAENSLALVNTLLLKIDEDEKVKLVQTQNTRLLISLLKVFISIALALGIGSIPILLFALFNGISFQELDFSSSSFIIALSIGSTIGFILPLKKESASSYSDLSKLLHRMALNNYAIALKLFRMEVKKQQKQDFGTSTQFVIVSGLARAGTTSLMNKLSENEIFASLNYGNMPFITAPRMWSKFYNPKKGESKERSHNDGILIGLESNEALEEFFFKMLANDSYITKETLVNYKPSESDHIDYLNYQAVIRGKEQKIYLAKNNNFILRYEAMRKYNSEFLIVFMFREPLVHAASLLEKHLEYSQMQSEDPFVLEYMNWLGHHEFGLEQKAFQFEDKVQISKEDKRSLDYWLEVWMNYYSYLLSLDRSNAIFADYDEYCQNPNYLIEQVNKKIGLGKVQGEMKPFNNKRKVELNYSNELKEKADGIFAELKKASQNFN